ncbi:MAG TPA: hypothetical protein VFE07_13785, partial [Marmoricola sp.]|nr:hypothetical protein [Marmoricola sp.]
PAPIVVTSTRRRRAGRPAGPPVPEDAPTDETGTDEPLPTAGEDELEPAPVEPEGPEEGPEKGPEKDAETDAETDEHGGHSLLHVPVKKKGSRKR